MVDSEHLLRNTLDTAVSRKRFDALLREWLERAKPGSTVGDVGSYGGKAWLWVDDGVDDYHLNADSDTFGVASYVATLDEFPGQPWAIVENSRGRKNKVVVGPNRVAISGFYLYLRDAG